MCYETRTSSPATDRQQSPRVHDFLIKELGEAGHGIYDPAANTAFVNVGVDC